MDAFLVLQKKKKTRLLQIHDYEQFYLDLRAANTNKTAEWIKEYDLTSYYKLKSVTTDELHNLAESLTRGSHESPLFEL